MDIALLSLLSLFKACSPSEREHKSEKDQRTIRRDQRKNFKHQRKVSLSRSLSLVVNGPLQ